MFRQSESRDGGHNDREDNQFHHFISIGSGGLFKNIELVVSAMTEKGVFNFTGYTQSYSAMQEVRVMIDEKGKMFDEVGFWELASKWWYVENLRKDPKLVNEFIEKEIRRNVKEALERVRPKAGTIQGSQEEIDVVELAKLEMNKKIDEELRLLGG